MSFRRLLCVALFSLTGLAIAQTTSAWQGQLLLGVGRLTAGKNQYVSLVDSPSPGLTNYYSRQGSQHFEGLLGVGVSYRFPSSSRWQVREGLELDWLRPIQLKGIVHPMANVSMNFDHLDYSVDEQSTLLLEKFRFAYRFNHCCQMFLQPMLGLAINRAFDYHESVPSGSTASPMARPFRNKTSFDFAYGVGLGLSFPLAGQARLSIAYRFVDLGSAKLGKTPVQTTSASFVTGPLHLNSLMFSLSF